ncbi:MAG TPA: DinB family protein, partial [Longimicrobium sp.]|nr:DinB family protein [Longimicrobium sp.]
TPAQFTQTVAGGYGSIRNTLVHVLSAEWGWLERCGGGPERGGRLDPERYPTAEAHVDDWSRVEAGMRRFLGGLKDEDVAREIEYQGGGGAKRSMPLGEVMHHVTNHSAHYRGQAALLLRELGHAPGDFDLLYYYSEKRGVPAW